MERYLTHKDVEHLSDDFMASKNWERVRFSLISTSPRTLVDRIYVKEGDILGFEIKPENTLDEEVKRGIGELACLIIFQIKPYLVISEPKFKVFKSIFEKIPWLGVLTYLPFEQNVGELINMKKPIVSKGLPITLPAGQLKPLTTEFIQAAIDELQIHGMCPANGLVKKLRRHYPNYRYSSRYMGTLLTQMGFPKTDGGYIVPEKPTKLGGGILAVTVPTSSTVPSSLLNDGMEDTPKICPICGALLKMKFIRKSAFLSCSNYPDCNFTKPINKRIMRM